MTLKELANRCNELMDKNPELADKPLAFNAKGGEVLEIAEFIEDIPPTAENDWAGEGHWKHGQFVGLIEVEW